ncbi:MAG TPA: TolC family protein [Vicinamibacteria bacterium]|nr:TolC family protein [Vicinamibacteria bacterium]
MRAAGRRRLLALVPPALIAAAAAVAVAEQAPRPIDLASTLRLAGANAVEVRIAEERLRAAQAGATVATWQLLPWVSVGAGYTAHGGLIQDVTGNIVTAEKHAYAVGPALVARVDVGDAIFRRLAALQTATAAEGALASQRQQVLLRAVQGYLDLLVAQASAAAAEEALAVARDYEAQLRRAVEAGIALKGDALRVRVQSQRSLLALEQARQERRVAAARLAELLRLGPAVDLAGRDDELVPLALEAVRAPAPSLVEEALAARPEVKEAAAGLRAAEETEKGARLGPLVPAVGFQVFAGGLGGGPEGVASESGSSRDYVATIGWRVGPGGLFDVGRTRLAEAHRTEAGWTVERVKDLVGREVVEAQARAQSGERQLTAAREGLAAAREGLELARQRREFEVGVVLENVLALQDEARARQDVARAVGDYAKAQYALLYALGRLGAAAAAMPVGP